MAVIVLQVVKMQTEIRLFIRVYIRKKCWPIDRRFGTGRGNSIITISSCHLEAAAF